MSLMLTDTSGRLLFCTDGEAAAEKLAAAADGLCTVDGRVYFVHTVLLAGKRYRLCIPADELSAAGTAFFQSDEENPFVFYREDKVCFSLGELLELLSCALHAEKIEGVKFSGDLRTVRLEAPPVWCALSLVLWMRLCRAQVLHFAAERGRLSLCAVQVPRKKETEILETLLMAVCAEAGFSFSIGDGEMKNYLLDFHPLDPASCGLKTCDLERRRAALARLIFYFIQKE